MIGVIVIQHGERERRWWKGRPKQTVRAIARAVAVLQAAEGAALHAERDGCILHAHMAAVARHQLGAVVPRRLMRDSEWVHRHIQAPGIRIQARIEDRMADS